MGALGHYIEEEGIPTTQISLIREHTETIRPPRALWVPFELGRPLGPPNRPGFQRRVLLATLGLLEREEGPVILEDFPEEAPAAAGEPSVLACPVSFGPAELETEDELAASFRREAASLRTWYDLALEERGGRTTANASGLAMDQAIQLLIDFSSGRTPDNPSPDLELGMALRLASEDIKAYYLESLTARPGCPKGSTELADWFWGQTVAAKVIMAAKKACLKSDDKMIQLMGNLLLVPRAQVHREG